jgi:hypothetical protein
MNQDFRDLLSEFNARGVRYLVVGAHALAAHGHVRATKDLDLWVQPTPPNARAVLEALRAFGAPLHDLSEKDLSEAGLIFQIGIAPVRIDILTALPGVEFSEAWSDCLKTRFEDQEVSVLSRRCLIRNKQAVARKQDLADVEWLETHPPPHE